MPPSLSAGWSEILREIDELDGGIYAAIARTPTPALDRPLRRLSRAADHGVLWLGVAGVLSLAGGRRGRRAAQNGVLAIAASSLLVNLGLKLAGRRARPDRTDLGVPEGRQVRMPRSPSFPSGHSASAFAFATAVSQELPLLALPLRGIAGLTAYSRVHSGVHYPSDVVVGALLGAAVGSVVAGWARRRGSIDL